MHAATLWTLLLACGTPDPVDTGGPDDTGSSETDSDADDTSVDPSDSEDTGDASGDTSDASDTSDTGPLYGPENSWYRAPLSAIPDDLVGEGVAAGEVLQRLLGVDQHGDAVDLHQFCGKVLHVQVAAGWCSICQNRAPDGQAMWVEYEDDGQIVLTYLVQDTGSDVPAGAFAATWANNFTLTHPVVADTGGSLTRQWSSYPVYLLVNREMRVLSARSRTLEVADIEAALGI